MKKLNAQELRISEPTEKEISAVKRNPIYLVMDRIIDTYNIGSLFRLADAVAAEKVYLCGDMEYPPSIKIHRAAVGTENWVPWKKVNSVIKLIKRLKNNGVHIIAIEQDKRANTYKDITPSFPVAIICGNETGGIEKQVLDLADTIVELPMYGINKSFNVWGSTAVVAYKILESL